jgi:hypothetical protein
MSDLTASLRDRAGILCAALEQWADPGTRRDEAATRRAGHDALDAVDALLRDLYALRGRLAKEIRQADDAARSRVA